MANIITDYDSVKSKLFTLTNSHYYSDQYKTLEIKYIHHLLDVKILAESKYLKC